MLAQNFKTPADLGILDQEFDALYKVLGMLERGELVHVPVIRFDEGCSVPNAFNMTRWTCGTAACIGGWVQRISGINMDLKTDHNKELERLFYPAEMNDTPLLARMSDATAAIALRNYLTHGEPRWAEALAE